MHKQFRECFQYVPQVFTARKQFLCCIKDNA